MINNIRISIICGDEEEGRKHERMKNARFIVKDLSLDRKIRMNEIHGSCNLQSFIVGFLYQISLTAQSSKILYINSVH